MIKIFDRSTHWPGGRWHCARAGCTRRAGLLRAHACARGRALGIPLHARACSGAGPNSPRVPAAQPVPSELPNAIRRRADLRKNTE